MKHLIIPIIITPDYNIFVSGPIQFRLKREKSSYHAKTLKQQHLQRL